MTFKDNKIAKLNSKLTKKASQAQQPNKPITNVGQAPDIVAKGSDDSNYYTTASVTGTAKIPTTRKKMVEVNGKVESKNQNKDAIKKDMGIYVPYGPSHKPVHLGNERNYSGIIDNLIQDHRERTKSNTRLLKDRQKLWDHILHLKQKYPNLKNLQALQPEHMHDDATSGIYALFQHLQEEHEKVKDKDPQKQAELENQINALYTGAHQWMNNKQCSTKTGKVGLSSPICKNRPTDKGATSKEDDGEKDDGPTEAVKKLMYTMGAAIRPEFAAAYHDLREHAFRVRKDKKGKTKDEATRQYNNVKTDLDNLEAKIAKHELHSQIGYSSNFATNLDFLHWYTKDTTKHDMNLVHLVNSHPELKGLRGFFGSIGQAKDGRKTLEITDDQRDRLMMFKVLLGPTSANLTPIANAETAFKIFQDGYYNYISQMHKKGIKIDPSKISMSAILRSANLNKKNLGELQVLKEISESNNNKFFDKNGNPLPSGKYPEGVNVYDKNGNPINKKWMARPASTEEFLNFVRDNPQMGDKDLIKHYFQTQFNLQDPNTPENIRDKTLLETSEDKSGKISYKHTDTLAGVFSLGKKFGPYVLSMASEYLKFYDKGLKAPFVADRVMTEVFSTWMNTVFGGAPENEAQRASYAHAMIETCKELGFVEQRKGKDGKTISVPRVDMLQAAIWSHHQGNVRSLGGSNPSSYLSHGALSTAEKSKIHAAKRVKELEKSNPKLAAELKHFAENFTTIQDKDIYATPEQEQQWQQDRKSYKSFGGRNYKIPQETLQKFLLRRINTSKPPSKRDVSARLKSTITLKSDKPIKYAQFTPVNGGMQSAPVSDRTNVPFGNAVAKVNTGKNIAHAQLNDQVAQKAGVRTTSSTAIGDWPNGSEQSTVHTADSMTEPERMRYLAAWHGLASQKKSVLVFHPNPKGPDSLYHINHPETDLGKLREQLNQFNLQYKTLVPGAKGTKVILFDPAKSNRSAIDQFATKNNLEVVENTGQGEILGHNGDWNSAGALPKSRQAYNNIIAQYEQNQNSTRSSSNPSGASSTGKQSSAGETKKQLQRAGRAIKFDKARRILEGFLRAHNTPNKELPHVGDLLANDLQNIKPEHITKYQQLVPGAKWNEIENAVTSLKSDPTLYEDMTSEANRREMYCKEHARTVLHSSGLQKLLDSLVVQKAIPEHAQHLIPDAKDGDYFALEAISAELNHGIPALKAFAKAAEREYNKAGKAWDKMRGGVQKFSKPHHSKSQHRAGKHGIVSRGMTYNAGQFAPQGDGVARFEKGCSKMNAIYKTINKFRGS